jgi:hypothetical protein
MENMSARREEMKSVFEKGPRHLLGQAFHRL